MKRIEPLRDRFGLTQNDFAHYLKIRRGRLALIETNRREYPTAALSKINEMQLFLIQYDAIPKKEPLMHEKEQLEKAQQILDKLEKEYQYTVFITRGKLEKMQKTYQQKVDLFHFITHLKADNKIKDSIEAGWITLMEIEALQGIRENGLHQQLQLDLSLQTAMVMLGRITTIKE